MAKGITEIDYKIRVKDSMASTISRLVDFQRKFPAKFEEFLKTAEVRRNLKTISSYLD